MRRICVLVSGWLVLSALLLPMLFVVWVSFSPDSFLTPPSEEWSTKWYRAFADDRRWMEAVGRSFVVGSGAVVVASVTGVPLGYAVARYRFRGRRVISGLALMPACVPPVVLGMGLLPLAFLTGLWGTYFGLMLAHGLLGLPIVYLLTRSHLEQSDPDLELAARGLGANPLQTMLRVTLPLLRPALLTGAVVVFAISLNEAMLTLFLATPSSETVPAVVWPQLRYAPSPLVAVASCVSVVIALIAVAVLTRFTPPQPRLPSG